MPLRGSPIFFVRSPHDDLQRIIRQWPLQCLGLVPRRAHPNIPLLVGGQDHRHGLGMDRLDNGVRRSREDAVGLMRPRRVDCQFRGRVSRRSDVCTLGQRLLSGGG
jgi:hypothetical protein